MKSGQVDLTRIAELLTVDFQEYSGYIACQCLFHDDSRPSMFIYPDKYRCSACGAWGYTDKLLRQLEGSAGTLIKPKKRVDFNNPFSRWTQNQSLPKALQIAWESNKKSPSIYMENRGISPKNQVKFGIGLRDGWITFPIRNKDGKIIGGVARALDKAEKSKYVVPSNQDPNLLYVPDWNTIKSSKYIFITFGIIDALSLATYGFASASTTNGKRIDPFSLHDMKKIIFFIPDKGEEADANKIASQLDWRGRVMRINYPDDCKDINDVHTKYPKMIEEMRKKWLK